MLQKYIGNLSQVLQNLQEVEGGSFSDYIKAVGLEFGIIGILLLYLIVIVIAIGFPIVVLPKVVKKSINKMCVRLNKIDEDIWEFWSLDERLHNLVKNKELEDAEIIERLNETVGSINRIKKEAGYSDEDLLKLHFDESNIGCYRCNSKWFDVPLSISYLEVDRTLLRLRIVIRALLIIVPCILIYLMLLVPLFLMII